MNENAKKWVAALRSGKYKQGIGGLQTYNAFCCLGVACELAVEAGVIPPPAISSFGVVRYADKSLTLPEAVVQWLGISTPAGQYHRDHGKLLTADNDGGATFAEIADIIESEPEGLFV